MLPSCVLVTLLARLWLRYRKLFLLQGVLTSLRPGRRGDDRLGRRQHSSPRSGTRP